MGGPVLSAGIRWRVSYAPHEENREDEVSAVYDRYNKQVRSPAFANKLNQEVQRHGIEQN